MTKDWIRNNHLEFFDSLSTNKTSYKYKWLTTDLLEQFKFQSPQKTLRETMISNEKYFLENYFHTVKWITKILKIL